MTLSVLTKELLVAINKKVEEGKKKGEIEDDLEKIIFDRIIYPSDWDDLKMEIGYVSRRKPIGYYLILSAFPEIAQEKILPLLTALLADSSKKQFRKETFEFKANVYWPADLFANEINLEDITNVDIRGSFYTHDPTKARIGFQGRSHKLEARLNGHELVISAEGDYNSLLESVIKEVKPQFATVRFSRTDAETLIGCVRGIRKRLLEKRFKPEKRTHVNIEMNTGVAGFGEQEIIEVTVPIKNLVEYSKILGKPLTGKSNGETFIVNLTKRYLLRRSILSDLKKVVYILSNLKTSTVFNRSLLTVSQAEELLNEEIDIISKSYENPFLFGMNTHLQRGPLVKRLAEEHFGKEILESFNEMEPNQYLTFLKEQGFNYKGELDRGHEPDYILKEKYLLSSFKQSYRSNSSRSMMNFRKWYSNAQPKIKITGSIKSDASRIPKLSLPSYATLTGFELGERTRKDENEISITREHDETIHFWVRVSLDSSGHLLDLQEKACETLGVKFR